MYQVKLYIVVEVSDKEAKHELDAIEEAKDMLVEEIENTKLKNIKRIIKSWFSSEVKRIS